RLDRTMKSSLERCDVVSVNGVGNSLVGSERTGRETENDLRICRPPHFAGREVPFPRRNLSHCECESQALFVVPNFAMGARQFSRTFQHTRLEFVLCDAQLFLRPLPLGNFGIQCLYGRSE